MKFGGGPLVGWQLVVPPPEQREKDTIRTHLLQLIYLGIENRLEAERRYLAHPTGRDRTPFGYLLAREIASLTEEAMRARSGPPSDLQIADAEGFRLSWEMVNERLAELEKSRGLAIGPSQPTALVSSWLLSDGTLFVCERHPLRWELWRIVQEPTGPLVDRDTKPANVIADRDLKPDNITGAAAPIPDPSPPPPHAASTSLAAASTDEWPGDVGGAGPSTPTEGAGVFPASESFPLAGAEASSPSAPAGPVLVGQLVPEAVARMREAQRVAAEATLAAANAVLLVPERQLAGGDRVPTSPGVRCCWCGRALGDYAAVCDRDDQGAYRWAHKQCALDELLRHRGAYGTLADMRAELGRAGVQLTGGEAFNELRDAVKAARRQDLAGVEWSTKKPKQARTERPCGLCPDPTKGQLVRDAGEGRVAHESCLEAAGLVTKEEATP